MPGRRPCVQPPPRVAGWFPCCPGFRRGPAPGGEQRQTFADRGRPSRAHAANGITISGCVDLLPAHCARPRAPNPHGKLRRGRRSPSVRPDREPHALRGGNAERRGPRRGAARRHACFPRVATLFERTSSPGSGGLLAPLQRSHGGADPRAGHGRLGRGAREQDIADIVAPTPIMVAATGASRPGCQCCGFCGRRYALSSGILRASGTNSHAARLLVFRAHLLRATTCAGAARASLPRHRAILNAIKRKQPAAARRAMLSLMAHTAREVHTIETIK